MTYKTHIAGGVCAAAVLVNVYLKQAEALPAWQLAAMAVICIGGALVPDIDLKTTKVGQAVKPVSWVIEKLFGHRTICHAPLLYLIIAFFSIRANPDAAPYMIAFTAGAFSHLLLDMLNKKGIPIFYPISKRFHLLTIDAKNGWPEKLIRVLLVAASAVTAVVTFLPYVTAAFFVQIPL